MSSQHYIVAGSGLAGLSAAIELASHGVKVTVYEQSKTIGGRAATHHQQGYAMNIGPHGFYRLGFMRQQFDAWGIPHPGKPPAQQSNSFLLAGGRKHPFPTGLTQLLTCSAFTIPDRLRVAKSFAAITRVNPESARGLSMGSWIDHAAPSIESRQMLAALTRVSTYSADMARLDAAAALRQLQIAFKASVLYIDGGWQTLIAGLTEKAAALGVIIVKEMGLIGGFDADGIVLAIPPKDVEALTGTTKLGVLTPVHAACLDLGLRRLPEHAATFALGLDEPYYVSVHSAAAAGLAPANSAMVHVAKYLDTGQTATRGELENLADLTLPGWRSEVEVARFLPDMTVVHAMPTIEGRPDVDALSMPNVMIAGDWVGPDAMLADAAVASGVRAARRLVKTNG